MGAEDRVPGSKHAKVVGGRCEALCDRVKGPAGLADVEKPGPCEKGKRKNFPASDLACPSIVETNAIDVTPETSLKSGEWGRRMIVDITLRDAGEARAIANVQKDIDLPRTGPAHEAVLAIQLSIAYPYPGK